MGPDESLKIEGQHKTFGISNTWLTAVVLLLGFAYLFLGIFQKLDYLDEGVSVEAAVRVARGEVPYRDFWAYYAPGQSYTLAGVFRVFGFSILTERIWDTLVRWAICLLTLLVGRELGLRRAAYCPFLIALVFLGFYGVYGSAGTQAGFWNLLAILLFLHSLSKNRLRFAFLSGLATGVAAVYRHDSAVYTFLSIVGALLLVSLQDYALAGQNWAKAVERLKTLFVFIAAICVVVIPVALYFLHAVPLADLRTDFVEFPRIQFRFRAVPLPPIVPSLSYLLDGLLLLNSWFVFYAPLAVFLISWIGLAQSFRNAARDPEASRRRFGRVLFTLMGSLLLIPVLARADWMHCYMLVGPASFVIPMLLRDWPVERRRAWSKVLVTLGLLVPAVPVVVIPTVRWHMHLSDYAPWHARTSSLPRARYFRVDPDTEEAVQFIRQNVPRDQAIFVGNSQHHRVFSNEPLFYFLAERRAGTRFYDFVPGVITTTAVQQEVIHDLERNHVNYLVLVSGHDQSRDRKEVPPDSGVTLLDDFIRSAFRPVQTFGHYSVWQKNTDF